MKKKLNVEVYRGINGGSAFFPGYKSKDSLLPHLRRLNRERQRLFLPKLNKPAKNTNQQ
jgi:hypothetical protein